jgi:phosphohistidine phosphatase
MSAIDLYLIRHGLAGQLGDYVNDDERPLTDEGKRKTKQVAKRLVELGVMVDLILTSPLVRAQQTADILKEAGLSKSLAVADYLATGNMDDWLTWFEGWRSPAKSLALVGHEPTLSAWAELLTVGSATGNLVLKKAGVIGLMVPVEESPIGHSQLFWLTPPRLLLDQ